jgi:hypothetical protein
VVEDLPVHEVLKLGFAHLRAKRPGGLAVPRQYVEECEAYWVTVRWG